MQSWKCYSNHHKKCEGVAPDGNGKTVYCVCSCHKDLSQEGKSHLLVMTKENKVNDLYYEGKSIDVHYFDLGMAINPDFYTLEQLESAQVQLTKIPLELAAEYVAILTEIIDKKNDETEEFPDEGLENALLSWNALKAIL